MTFNPFITLTESQMSGLQKNNTNKEVESMTVTTVLGNLQKSSPLIKLNVRHYMPHLLSDEGSCDASNMGKWCLIV